MARKSDPRRRKKMQSYAPGEVKNRKKLRDQRRGRA